MTDSAAGLTIAVIGAGQAGREFALRCALVGCHVVLEDVMPDKLRHAEEAFTRVEASVTLVSTVEDAVRTADLAIDFVPDELESKLEIWSLLDRMGPPQMILCTPSEVLSITDLASCTYRRDRCLMLRGDLESRELLEILTSAWTSESTVERAGSLLAGLGRSFTVHQDPDLPQLLKNMNASSV